MNIISQMLATQGLGAGLTMSQEEFDEVETELLEEMPEESEAIDDEFDGIEQTEEAAASLESLAEMIIALPGLSAVGYGHAMNAANRALGAAGIYSQMTAISTEDDAATTDEDRKASAADRLKARAGGLKDAVVQAIRRLVAVIQGFFNKFFDRIERVKRAAAAKMQTIKDGATIKISIEWARQFTNMRQFELASKGFGGKAVDAIKHLKAGGDSTEAYEKLSSLMNSTGIPQGLIGNPHFDKESNKLVADLPANNGGSTQAVDPVKVRDALAIVGRVCDDILNQRNALKSSALSANEQSLAKAFGAQAQAETFSKALSMVNKVYKGWSAYVGKVCQGIVSCVAAAETAAKPAEGDKAE